MSEKHLARGAVAVLAAAAALVAPASVARAADPIVYKYENQTQAAPGYPSTIRGRCSRMSPYLQSVSFTVNRLYGGAASYHVADSYFTNYAGDNVYSHITIVNDHPEWYTWPPNYNYLSFKFALTCTSDPNASFAGPSFAALKTLPPDGVPRTLSATCPADVPYVTNVRPSYAAPVTITNAQRSAPGENPGWATAEFTNPATAAAGRPAALVVDCTQTPPSP